MFRPIPDAPLTDGVPNLVSHLDPSLPIEERVDRLLAQMTLPEKAGLMFHAMLMPGAGGEVAQGNHGFGVEGAEELIINRGMRHFNVLGSAGSPGDLARWHNSLQELAASTRLGIPVTLSTDPRHSFTDNPGTAAMAGAFSQWPEPFGLAAIGDEALIEHFADIVRREYLAVGIRSALHPQLDLATEPRWARQVGTFGEDAALTARLGAAYVRGLQGPDLGPDSVAAMIKHFPGAGPQWRGEDAHFAYGREQVYPGGLFDLHLEPFVAAIAAGAAQVMPYYGMPVGTPLEEVGFGFNRDVVTGLLREKLGFYGVVCTDWGLLSDSSMMGEVFPARAWGVEHLTVPERMKLALEAGVDQFGGEQIPEVLVELVHAGEVAEARVDESVRRILRVKFALGLFESSMVDPAAAPGIVGAVPFREAGAAAQRASVTILTNAGSDPALPAARGTRLYVEGIDKDVAARYGTTVDSPEDAQLAVIRLAAPYEQRPGTFERFFHAGSLDFGPAIIEHVMGIAARVPTVVDVFLDRPAILTPFVDTAAALTVNYGASAEALLDVLFGVDVARGRLPVDLPRSMAAVEASREDVPFDTQSPLFRHGHGIEI